MLDSQLEELINKDDVSPDKGLEIIRNKLDYHQMAQKEKPPSPCQIQHKYENPGIIDYCSKLSWDNGWTPIDEVSVLQSYPEYLPTDESIDIISKYDPILEIGAGSGYWSYVLKKANVNITPTDLLPIDLKEYDIDWDNLETLHKEQISISRTGPKSIDPGQWSDENIDFPYLPWTHITIASHKVISEFSSHTIMSCHPPAQVWTEEMLSLLDSGQKFIFIGEWYPGADATPFFFKELKTWNLLETFPVYDWASMHAKGYVFEKP